MKKTNFYKFYLMAAALWLGMAQMNAATYYYSGRTTSNGPRTASNYNVNRDGTGESPANFTTAGDVFVFQANPPTGTGTISFGSSHAWGSASAAITFRVEAGADVTHTGASTIYGTLEVEAGAKFSNTNGTIGGYPHIICYGEIIGTGSNNITANSITGNGFISTQRQMHLDAAGQNAEASPFLYCGGGTISYNAPTSGNIDLFKLYNNVEFVGAAWGSSRNINAHTEGTTIYGTWTNNSGRPSPAWTQGVCLGGDTPLDTPDNLEAEVTCSEQATLSWNAVTDAD